MKELHRDTREEKLEQKIKALAEAGDWQAVIQALDGYDANNEGDIRGTGQIWISPSQTGNPVRANRIG